HLRLARLEVLEPAVMPARLERGDVLVLFVLEHVVFLTRRSVDEIRLAVVNLGLRLFRAVVGEPYLRGQGVALAPELGHLGHDPVALRYLRAEPAGGRRRGQGSGRLRPAGWLAAVGRGGRCRGVGGRAGRSAGGGGGFLVRAGDGEGADGNDLEDAFHQRSV